jgi:isopenicillin-N N-acyltransferase-like protein
MPTQDFPLIDIAGSPLSRGRDYGSAAATRVKLSAALYHEQLRSFSLSREDITAIIHRVIPPMNDFAPDLLTEMRGIAEGSGLAFEDVVLINARTEIIQIGRRQSGADLPDEFDGCTGIVALPGATQEKRLIHAQNWDWRAECAETGIILRVRSGDGHELLTFTEAGGLARSGFNSDGLSITANYLESDRDYRRNGVPLPLIRRRYLECRHFAQGVRIVATTPKSASNNMMLATAEGFAINFECAPDEAFALYPEDGLIIHANHWRSPVALAKLKETGIVAVPDSIYRDWRAEQLIGAKRGAITVDDVKSALFDDFGTPFSICRPARQGSGGNISATVAMIVMVPAAGYMEVMPLPAERTSFTRYALAGTGEPARRLAASVA